MNDPETQNGFSTPDNPYPGKTGHQFVYAEKVTYEKAERDYRRRAALDYAVPMGTCSKPVDTPMPRQQKPKTFLTRKIMRCNNVLPTVDNGPK